MDVTGEAKTTAVDRRANGPFDHDWRERCRRDIVERAERFVAGVAADADQERLLRTTLVELRAANAAPGAIVVSLHFPLLIVAALQTTDADGRDLALVTTLVELGVDLLDHLADEELGPHWNDVSPGTIHLASTGLLCALAPLAIARLATTADRAARLHAEMAQGLVATGAGQQRDLGHALNRQPSLETAERIAMAKTGARRGLYARLAAIFAGADQDTIDACDACGQELGMARQLASDMHDLFRPNVSRDLTRGLHTWPVAWTLSHIEGDDRRSLLDALDRARTDVGAQAEVRDQLRRGGAVLRTGLEVELHKSRALDALNRARLREPAATALRELIAEG